VNPVLLPFELTIRVLDDVHLLALSARDATKVMASLEHRAARIEEQVDSLLSVARSIEQRADEVLSVGRAILEVGDRMDVLGRDVLIEGKVIQDRAKEVADRAGDILAALPLLERALQMATPLEGAVERLGRVVDRLPGGNRKPAPAKPAAAKPASASRGKKAPGPTPRGTS
jgi:hypothetical protein